ncbi:zinc finger protein 671-like [Odocoileus virginianus]|uniref:Zinc finger protein 671-like n=1 Tax=Odocoileus virginianus TaxID=9874 RepID=A0ABM4HTA2_ODOVR
MADAAPHTGSLSPIVTFADVFIDFTREEWDLLTESQKRLYHKTMVDNFSLVMSVGLDCSRYRLISPPESERAPVVPARIGIAAAVAEVSQESPGPSPGPSVEDRDASSEQGMPIKISNVESRKVVPSIQNSHLCDMCNPTFSGVFQLAGQPETSSEQQPYICGSCGRAFPLSVSLDQMERWQSGGTVARRERDQAFSVNSHRCHGLGTACTCEKGEEDVSASSGVVQHRGTHNAENPCTSAERKESFHTGQKERQCSGSEGAYNQEERVQEERVPEERVPEERVPEERVQEERVQQQEFCLPEMSYECNTCGRVFNCRDLFNNHQKVHTRERSWNCDECGKSFTRKSYVKVHKRLHSGIRPFVCDKCGKSYISKSHLNVHSKSHTIESLQRLIAGNMLMIPALANLREVTPEHGLSHSANGQDNIDYQVCGKSSGATLYFLTFQDLPLA